MGLARGIKMEHFADVIAYAPPVTAGNVARIEDGLGWMMRVMRIAEREREAEKAEAARILAGGWNFPRVKRTAASSYTRLIERACLGELSIGFLWTLAEHDDVFRAYLFRMEFKRP